MQFNTTKSVVTTSTSTGTLSAEEVEALVLVYAKKQAGAGSAATAKATRADDGSFTIEIVDILTGDAPAVPTAAATVQAAQAAPTGLHFPS